MEILAVMMAGSSLLEDQVHSGHDIPDQAPEAIGEAIQGILKRTQVPLPNTHGI